MFVTNETGDAEPDKNVAFTKAGSYVIAFVGSTIASSYNNSVDIAVYQNISVVQWISYTANPNDTAYEPTLTRHNLNRVVTFQVNAVGK